MWSSGSSKDVEPFRCRLIFWNSFSPTSRPPASGDVALDRLSETFAMQASFSRNRYCLSRGNGKASFLYSVSFDDRVRDVRLVSGCCVLFSAALNEFEGWLCLGQKFMGGFGKRKGTRPCLFVFSLLHTFCWAMLLRSDVQPQWVDAFGSRPGQQCKGESGWRSRKPTLHCLLAIHPCSDGSGDPELSHGALRDW